MKYVDVCEGANTTKMTKEAKQAEKGIAENHVTKNVTRDVPGRRVNIRKQNPFDNFEGSDLLF